MATPGDDGLTLALARWRDSLAAHEALTPERIRELECHLRDALADVRARGITADEAFHIATRRVGDAAPLSSQFAAANPAAVWRARVFWMLLGLIVVQTIFLLSALLRFFMFETVDDPHGALHWLADGPERQFLIGASVFGPLALVIAVMIAFVRLAKGRWSGLALGLEKLCFRRGPFAWRLFFWSALLPLTLLAMQVLVFASDSPSRLKGMPVALLIPVLLMTALSLTLAALAAKFAPRQALPVSD